MLWIVFLYPQHSPSVLHCVRGDVLCVAHSTTTASSTKMTTGSTAAGDSDIGRRVGSQMRHSLVRWSGDYSDCFGGWPVDDTPSILLRYGIRSRTCGFFKVRSDVVSRLRQLSVWRVGCLERNNRNQTQDGATMKPSELLSAIRCVHGVMSRWKDRCVAQQKM